MIYSQNKGSRTFSGEVETENELVLIDELTCEHLPFSKIKKELNKELKFCSSKVLIEYLTNLKID